MSAVWTTPKTWLTGEIMKASDFNTHLRDNLDWLKARPIVASGSIVNTSTTSTSLVDMASMQGSLVTNGGRLLTSFTGFFIADSAFRTLTLAVNIDGSIVAGSLAKTNVTTIGNGGTPCHFIFRLPPPSVGLHTVTIQWSTSGGTIEAASSTCPRGFFAYEAS